MQLLGPAGDRENLSVRGLPHFLPLALADRRLQRGSFARRRRVRGTYRTPVSSRVIPAAMTQRGPAGSIWPAVRFFTHKGDREMSSPIDPEVLELLREYRSIRPGLMPFIAFFQDGTWSLREGLGWGTAVVRGNQPDMLPELRQLLRPRPTKAQLLKACQAAEKLMFVSQEQVEAVGLLRRHVESLEG